MSIDSSKRVLVMAFVFGLFIMVFGTSNHSCAAEGVSDPKLAPPVLKIAVDEEESCSNYYKKQKGKVVSSITYDSTFLKKAKCLLYVRIANKNGKKNKIKKIQSSDKSIATAEYNEFEKGEGFKEFSIVPRKPGKAELTIIDKYGAEKIISVVVKKSFYRFYLRTISCHIYRNNHLSFPERYYIGDSPK